MDPNRNPLHPTRPAARRVIKILGTLFLLPFLGVGAFMLVLAFRTFGDANGSVGQPIAMAAGGLVFTGFALFALYWLRVGVQAAAALQKVQASDPDRPWLWREDWARGRVESSGRRGLLFTWFFAGLWNLISLPAALAVPAEVQRGNTIALVALLFPLIGIFLLIWAVRAALRRLQIRDDHQAGRRGRQARGHDPDAAAAWSGPGGRADADLRPPHQ